MILTLVVTQMLFRDFLHSEHTHPRKFFTAVEVQRHAPVKRGWGN